MAALTPLQSLVACGTKLWLDSVDPQAVKANRAYGATGATSNPIIIADLIKTGRFDDLLTQLIRDGKDDTSLAWHMTDHLVKEAQAVFLPVWQETRGDDGYVSFELDPLLEDASCKLPVAERTKRYVELGKEWSKGHKNRMIKVPATPAGLAALEELAAHGVTLNVTLIFGSDQYKTARDAIWRGAQRRPGGLSGFKSVYSIFVSRLDVYTAEKEPGLSPAAQGQVGIVNAKRIWQMNRDFWKDKGLALKEEMIFASTGTKRPEDPPWKYVEAFAGSDIETNPPATNDAVQKSGRLITAHIHEMPPAAVLKEIDEKVDMHRLEKTLMEEGLRKFADPQKALLRLIAEKRASLQTAAPH
ncbi:MAG TPA: transaldolase family protein [Gemmataceae bacterium]|jgi:transaldolase|nr:transaldolase family protein [Gemmataceae bacterium]